MLICQSSRDTRLKTVKSFHAVLIQYLRWWFGFHGPTMYVFPQSVIKDIQIYCLFSTSNWSSTSGTFQLDSILSCQLSGLYSLCLNKHRGKLIQTVSPVFGMEPLTDCMDGAPLWLFYISFPKSNPKKPRRMIKDEGPWNVDADGIVLIYWQHRRHGLTLTFIYDMFDRRWVRLYISSHPSYWLCKLIFIVL